jgi:hypothetical protein
MCTYGCVEIWNNEQVGHSRNALDSYIWEVLCSISARTLAYAFAQSPG